MSYFPRLAETFSELLASVANDRVFVLGHARPDGDCVGAQIALARLLRGYGVDAVALNADPIPKALGFLLGETKIEPLVAPALDGRPLLFVDCADERRVGPKSSQLIADCNFLASIDHHISNTRFARMNLIEPSTAATCEIIAGLAFDFGLAVDATTAQALLTGIMTDTGRFGYAATSARVFELCSRLVQCGARPEVSAQPLYENQPFSRLKLLQRFLGALRTEFDGKLGVGTVARQDFVDTASCYEETEGFVDFTRSIEGVVIGLYLEERRTTVKASLRAVDSSYRVDLIAKQFGGGGHAAAAAFSFEGSIAEVESPLITAIGNRIQEVEAESA